MVTKNSDKLECILSVMLLKKEECIVILNSKLKDELLEECIECAQQFYEKKVKKDEESNLSTCSNNVRINYERLRDNE